MPQATTTSAGDRPFSGVDLSITSPTERIKDFLSFARSPDFHGFDTILLPHLTLLSASPALTTFSLAIPAGLANRRGTLHGGAAALLLDLCTTCALVPLARDGVWQFAGVTRSLNVSFLRPAMVGTTVEVRCEVVNVGRRLASIRGEIWSTGEEPKRLIVCEHLKVATDPSVEGKGAKL